MLSDPYTLYSLHYVICIYIYILYCNNMHSQCARIYCIYTYIYIHMFFQRHIHLRSTFWCQKALPHLEIQLLQGQVVGRNFRHLCVSARQWSCLIKTSTGGATVTATGAIWQQTSTGVQKQLTTCRNLLGENIKPLKRRLYCISVVQADNPSGPFDQGGGLKSVEQRIIKVGSCMSLVSCHGAK